ARSFPAQCAVDLGDHILGSQIGFIGVVVDLVLTGGLPRRGTPQVGDGLHQVRHVAHALAVRAGAHGEEPAPVDLPDELVQVGVVARAEHHRGAYDQRAPVAGGFPVAVDRLGRVFGASVVVHRCAGGVLIGRGVVFAVDSYRGVEAQVRDAVVLHCRTDRPRAPHVDRFERGGADPEVVVGGRQVEHGGAPLHRLDEGADVAHVADVGGVITVRVRVEVEADHLHAHGG